MLLLLYIVYIYYQFFFSAIKLFWQLFFKPSFSVTNIYRCLRTVHMHPLERLITGRGSIFYGRSTKNELYPPHTNVYIVLYTLVVWRRGFPKITGPVHIYIPNATNLLSKIISTNGTYIYIYLLLGCSFFRRVIHRKKKLFCK